LYNGVWQPVERIVAVRSTRLSNRLSNPFDNRLYRVNGVLGLRLSGVPLVYSKLCFVCDLVLNSVRHPTVLHFHWTQGSISWGHVSLERTSVPRVCVDVNSLYCGRLRGSRAPRLHQRRIFISHMTFTYCRRMRRHIVYCFFGLSVTLQSNQQSSAEDIR